MRINRLTHRVIVYGAVLILLFAASPAFAATYKVDSDHTTVSFKARHLFSNVIGTFKQFEGTFDYEPGQPETWKVNATVQTASIDTNVTQRDNHLRSPDFFDAEKYPTLTFSSTKVTDLAAGSAKLEGLLTIHGIGQPVVFDLTINGVGKDPWGNTRASFSATTKIDRKDFGLTWNKVLESGQLLVGDEITITLEVEGLLQA